MKAVYLKQRTSSEQEGLEFPILAQAVVTDDRVIIVLFTNETTGTIVYDTKHIAGGRYSYVIPVTHKDHWRILGKDESIVLSNA